MGSAAAAVVLAGTSPALAAIACGPVLALPALSAHRGKQDPVALFLAGQPPVFLAWDASPYLSATAETFLLLALVLSCKARGTGEDTLPPGVVLLIPWVLAFSLASQRHVFIPLLAILAASAAAALVVLGTASHIVSRATGGSP
ncbi:MAG: hypothetical protein QFX32_07900 [Methanolinea sp.]|nr:hypothetical protein [Methanolinea sp.]